MASIQKRGKTYRIAVSNGRKPDGTQIIETTTFCPDLNKTEKQNQKALELFVLEFEQKVKSGKYLDGEKLTFQAFHEIWLRDYAEQNLDDTTVATYKRLLNAHILPAIGHLKLSKVQPNHLNKLYYTLSHERRDGKEGGYAPKTIKHIHNIISIIYSTAMKWNVVLDNPCDRVDIPKQTPTRDKIKYFNIEQTECFIQLLDKDYITTCSAHDRVDDTGKAYHVAEYNETRKLPTQFKLFFLLAVYGGMRRGEILALEWSDLDFMQHSVSITKSTTIVDGKPLTKGPKTRSSVRVVSVPAFIMELAREWKTEQLRYRMAIGSQWIGENHIFIQWNGKQMHPDTPYKTFKRIIKRYNETVTNEADKLPDIPLHGLRHTSATLLISQNVDVRTVSGRLGHAQTSTTMDIYSHALKEMDEKASDALDQLLNRKI